jgi:hypothetical protein
LTLAEPAQRHGERGTLGAVFNASKTGDDTGEIVMASWLFPGMGLFFMALGALNILALFIVKTSKDPSSVIVPGVFCTVFGIAYGFYPIRVVVKVDRTTDELTRSSRSIFSNSSTTEKLSDFASVSVEAGTYYWFFNAVRKDGVPLRLFSQMKRTWTWTKVPPAEVLARAGEIAQILSLPVSPPT